MFKLKRAYAPMPRSDERRALVERPHDTEHNNARCFAQVLGLEDAEGERCQSERSRRTNPDDRVDDA